MKTAAGVLLLVIAVSNLLGGCTYVVLGGVAGSIGAGVGELAVSEEFNEAAELSDKDQAEMAEGGAMAMKLGGSVVLWGVFLLVLAGLQIGAGVQLFRAKGAVLIFIAAGLEILSDVVTMYMTGGFALFAGLGLVAAIMAISSAKGFSAVPAPVAAPAPVADPGPAPEGKAEAAPEAEADSD